MLTRVLLFAVVLAVGPAAAQMRIVGGDETARFVPLELGKSIVVELPAPVADVMVATPGIANVVMRTNTRAYVIATDVGDTSIYFFDAQKKRIEGLDLAVRRQAVQTPYPLEPQHVVTVVRGSEVSSLSCTQTTDFGNGAKCYDAPPRRR